MAGTFIDELARLNSQNFLGGLSEVGTALKELKQNQSVTDLYNEFRVKNSQLQTTDQQLSGLNNELAIKPEDVSSQKINNVIDAISNNALNLDKIMRQTDAYNQLYQPYITAFATLGDEGVKVANTLSRELAVRTDTLEKKAEVPFKEMEYKANLMNYTNNILNIQQHSLQLDELKKTINEDSQTKDLMAQMLQDPDGQQLYKWGTGIESVGNVLKDDAKVKEVNDRFYQKFSSNPAFNKALIGVTGARNFYRRSVVMPSGTGGGATGTMKDDETFTKLFSSLQDDSKLWDSVHSSNDYPYTMVRDYLFGQKDEKGNPIPRDVTTLQDPVIKGIVTDYINAFMKSDEQSYNKRFQMTSYLAKKHGKTLGFDFELPQYGISGKDILYFNSKTNQPIYEPYLYHKGYYQQGKNSSAPIQRQNMFAPQNFNTAPSDNTQTMRLQ